MRVCFLLPSRGVGGVAKVFGIRYKDAPRKCNFFGTCLADGRLDLF